jgi:Ca2+-binding RTX toxin-like protein
MANITGTIGNDELFGLDLEGDLVFALEGDDTVNGLDGNDTLVGGSGGDAILGNLGDDIIFGNSGVDYLIGNEGNDTILSGQDNDFIVDTLGNNLLFGNLGDDIIIGGAENDTIFAGQGNDLLFGQIGNDLLSGDLGDDTILGCNPLDEQPGLREIDTLTGGQGTNLFVFSDRLDNADAAPFYVGSGNSDFALITDFKPATDNFFVKQRELITFSNLTFNNFGDGVGIFMMVNGQPDLIAFLPGQNAGNLQIDRDFVVA